MQQKRYDNAETPVEIFDPDKLQAHLGKPETKEVRVFKLKLGMEVTIAGRKYKVTRMLPNGKAELTLQRREGE